MQQQRAQEEAEEHEQRRSDLLQTQDDPGAPDRPPLCVELEWSYR